MKKLLFLTLLISTYGNSQNSQLFLKDGSKIIVKDYWGLFTTGKLTRLKYQEQKDNGKFSSGKGISVDKIDRLETLNGVTYKPYDNNNKSFKGLHKTLIKGKDKSLICCFKSFGDFDESTSVAYIILDANNNEILSNFFFYGVKDKQKIMFDAIKKHFPDCPEVFQSIEDYKNVEAVFNIHTGGEPVGFMFQNRVFDCN